MIWLIIQTVFIMFQTYLRYIPPFGTFYRVVTKNYFRFSNQVMGIYKLAHHKKNMINKAGFETNFTGHFKKLTTATALCQMGFEEQLMKWLDTDQTQLGRSERQCMLTNIFDNRLILKRGLMPSPVRSKRQYIYITYLSVMYILWLKVIWSRPEWLIQWLSITWNIFNYLLQDPCNKYN